jgi:uncharacterized protein YwbE
MNSQNRNDARPGLQVDIVLKQDPAPGKDTQHRQEIPAIPHITHTGFGAP